MVCRGQAKGLVLFSVRIKDNLKGVIEISEVSKVFVGGTITGYHVEGQVIRVKLLRASLAFFVFCNILGILFIQKNCKVRGRLCRIIKLKNILKKVFEGIKKKKGMFSWDIVASKWRRKRDFST